MHLIIFNVEWMSWNLFLAALGVLFGWLTVYSKHKMMKVLWFLMWFLFLPNTSYILTDLKHLPYQLQISPGWWKLAIASQFAVFITGGIVTFIYGIYYFEKMLLSFSKKLEVFILPLVTILNFIVAFGVILGRVMRTNSWYVFTDFNRVVQDIAQILTSPIYMSYVIAFGLVGNIIYFAMRESLTPRKVLLLVTAKN